MTFYENTVTIWSSLFYFFYFFLHKATNLHDNPFSWVKLLLCWMFYQKNIVCSLSLSQGSFLTEYGSKSALSDRHKSFLSCFLLSLVSVCLPCFCLYGPFSPTSALISGIQPQEVKKMDRKMDSIHCCQVLTSNMPVTDCIAHFWKFVKSAVQQWRKHPDPITELTFLSTSISFVFFELCTYLILNVSNNV